MSYEYGNDILTLIDEDGNENEFEVLDMIEYEDGVYVALMPVLNDPNEFLESDGSLIVMKYTEDEDGEEVLDVVEDEDELNAVLDIFEERLSEEYEIEK